MKSFWITSFFLILSFSGYSQEAKDRVFMVDRSIKEGTVVNIDNTQIIFEEKTSLGSKTPIRLSTIWKIIYSNGFEEVFNQPLPENLIVSGNSSDVSSAPKEGLISKSSKNESTLPLISTHIGLLAPVIIGPEQWTSPEDGLALRFGYGGELGFSYNPFKYLGVTISQGYTSHASFLPEINRDSTTVIKDQIKLNTLPTTLRINIYPKETLTISAGITSSGLSLTGSNPEIKNQRLNGYTVGLGKLMPIGNGKSYLEFTLDYSSISADPFMFSLDNEKYPELESLDLVFSSISTVNIKAKFVFGLKD
ncbi:hypothetical protein [Algoriphagus boritolerans]|uniref:Outer membrane protein beta-barrel domain-containing protein n=1 Tax=Algoriphagus boritolerans DSM 17298 = JCM 18970 TaxID=1120964 RepID=A0A1H5ZDM3_9BACT|nr:hypothetical protein [Algoriphagus boritolerans]SEG34371.1 hypothetical protein SAMN03080598_03460 [Algoriphagus boritolerans DSM 17298 = JCM 18970]